jgi:hypothetical protein
MFLYKSVSAELTPTQANAEAARIAAENLAVIVSLTKRVAADVVNGGRAKLSALSLAIYSLGVMAAGRHKKGPIAMKQSGLSVYLLVY